MVSVHMVRPTIMKKSRLLGCLLFALSCAAPAEEFKLKAEDFYTLICINGLEYTEMRAECSSKFPKFREPLETAILGWRSRNADALLGVASACKKRFQKLTEQNPSRLQEIRNFADSLAKTPLSKREGYIEHQFASNCEGLAKAFADPRSDSNRSPPPICASCRPGLKAEIPPPSCFMILTPNIRSS